MRSGKSMSCCTKGIRMSLTRICRSTLTRFRTPNFCSVWPENRRRQMLHLIKMWLKVPVEERDENGKRRLTGGKDNDRGTPQGGVISPAARQSVHEPDVEGLAADPAGGAVSGAHRELRGRFRDPQSRKSEGGTGMDAWGAGAAGTDSEREEDEHPERPAGAIRFSGIHIRAALQYRRTGQEYLGYSPSKKSVARIKEKVGELLEPGNVGALGGGARRLNQKLRGWRAYFSCGSTSEGIPGGRRTCL